MMMMMMVVVVMIVIIIEGKELVINNDHMTKNFLIMVSS
jgi:hypothetical protein